MVNSHQTPPTTPKPNHPERSPTSRSQARKIPFRLIENPPLRSDPSFRVEKANPRVASPPFVVIPASPVSMPLPLQAYHTTSKAKEGGKPGMKLEIEGWRVLWKRVLRVSASKSHLTKILNPVVARAQLGIVIRSGMLCDFVCRRGCPSCSWTGRNFYR